MFVVPVWKRTNVILGSSEVTVLWELPDNVEPGLYRVGHRGYWHTIIRGNIYYEGWSQTFTVANPITSSPKIRLFFTVKIGHS